MSAVGCVGGDGVDGVDGAGGEVGMESMGVEQGRLAEVFLVQFRDPSHDQAHGVLLGLLAGRKRGERNLGERCRNGAVGAGSLLLQDAHLFGKFELQTSPILLDQMGSLGLMRRQILRSIGGFRLRAGVEQGCPGWPSGQRTGGLDVVERVRLMAGSRAPRLE